MRLLKEVKIFMAIFYRSSEIKSSFKSMPGTFPDASNIRSSFIALVQIESNELSRSKSPGVAIVTILLTCL
jgi:hypothetical protein